ncbi:MAG: DsrE family protein [Desulfuromonadales bacterium]|nr:DsrE family protein [Desulfuromonadales bacterium]
MSEIEKRISQFFLCLFFAMAFAVLVTTPIYAGGYDNALNGVNGYNAIFDVGQGNPKVANIVFWAVKNTYEISEVNALEKAPRIAVVFHGPAVKLISSDRNPFNATEWAEVVKFQETLRQMKKDGVKLEVCLYAAEVMGVDKDTIMPEIDQVGNGFVSVIGYQMQGYALVSIP